MRKIIIILSVFAIIAGSCGKEKKKQTGANKATAQNTFSSVKDADYNRLSTKKYTVEDTVRYQIGGELHGLNLRPTDSITVIKSYHYQDEWGLYREYHFIVHNRYSYAHRYFSTAFLDSIYNSAEVQEYYHSWKLGSVQSKKIDPEIEHFNGFWVYLEEHNGNYYLDDDRACYLRVIHIADSTIFTSCQDFGFRKIIEATSISENAISILYDGFQEPVKMRIELFDKSRSIYRLFENKQIYFITPARAIHNFEIIQYTNNTGELM